MVGEFRDVTHYYMPVANSSSADTEKALPKVVLFLCYNYLK